MKDETKSTVTIIEEVCEDICENYCEYRNTICLLYTSDALPTIA